MEEIHELHLKKESFKQEFNRIMKENQVDVLLCPNCPHAATKAENIKKLGSLSYYSWLANLCDLPAGVVPVTQVKEGED